MYRAGDSFTLQFDVPEYRGIPTRDGTIAHYTSPESAVSILASSSFWATNAMYLNDSSELLHGAHHVSQWWASNSSSFDSETRGLIDALLPLAYALFTEDRFFVLSASNELEDVSQFTRYGPVALHLDARAVIYPPANRPSFPGDLKIFSLPPGWRSVAYEHSDKDRLVSSFFDQVAAHIRTKQGWAPQQNEVLTEWFSWWYCHLIAGMKDRRFRAEEEVRYLVMTEPAFDDVRRRDGRLGVTPYVAVEHIEAERDHLPLPITEIVVSPVEWNSTLEADLLEAAHVVGIDLLVRVSDVPLR